MPDRPRSVLSAFRALAAFVGLSALAGLMVTIGVTPVIAVAGQATGASIDMFEHIPDYLTLGRLQQHNVILAKSGGKDVELASIYHQNRVVLPADRISEHLRNAVIAGEDRRFRQHGGIDLPSLARAVVGSVIGGGLGEGGGGSTLTMQLVRNVLINQAISLDDVDERKVAYEQATANSVQRKLQEIRFAIGLDKRYTKDEILTEYLNIAYFGDNAYGVQAASRHYYAKDAADLTPVEAASLIAIVQYPAARNLASPDHYERNQVRRDVILESMASERMITAEQAAEAVATPIADYVHLTPSEQGCTVLSHPGAGQWCDLIRRHVQDLPALGATADERAANWRTGGYRVRTTLDLDQTALAKSELAARTPASESRYDLGSVVTSVETATGRVLVLTQNRDHDDGAGDDGSGTTSVNYAVDRSLGSSDGFQPGSTYKPFTLVDWLAKGHGLRESVDATPRTFSPMRACGKRESTTFAPKNYGGTRPGVMSALTATVTSTNTAYVAMAQKLDLCDIRDTAAALGVKAGDGGELSAVPASVIGSGSTVSPLSMASAFAGIANGGVACAPVFIDAVVLPDGAEREGDPQRCTQAVDHDAAVGATSAMQQVFTAGTARAAQIGDGVPIMGKTGTTDRAEQTWLVGGSSRVTTATWVGNVTGHADQYKLSNATGGMAEQRMAIFRNVQRSLNASYGGGAFPEAERATSSDGSSSGGGASGGTGAPAPSPSSTPSVSPTDPERAPTLG